MKVEGMQCRGNQRNPTISCTLFKFACSRMQIAESDIPSLVWRRVGMHKPERGMSWDCPFMLVTRKDLPQGQSVVMERHHRKLR